MATIEQRLERLERQNRWMRRAGGLVLAGLAAFMLVGQGKSESPVSISAKSITAEKLTIRYPEPRPDTKADLSPSKARLELGLDPVDSSVIRMYDRRGIVRFRLRNDPLAGAVLQIRDEKRRERIMLGTYNYGAPALEFRDEGGRVRCWLTLDRHSNATLRIGESGEKTRTAITESRIALYDGADTLRVWIGVDAKNTKSAIAAICDPKGTTVWRVPER